MQYGQARAASGAGPAPRGPGQLLRFPPPATGGSPGLQNLPPGTVPPADDPAPSRFLAYVAVRQSSPADARKEHALATPLIRRPEGDGTSPQIVLAATGPAEYVMPATWRGIGAQAAAVLGLLTGVWVALSPWFITLQNQGGNAAVVNLISGLAVAAVGAFAGAGTRSRPQLRSMS
jgi:hypothetical protein